MKKYANKSRGLLMYAEGKDVYKKTFWVQDGSYVFPACRIYHTGLKDKEVGEHCLTLNKKQAEKLIKGLTKFVISN